MLNPIAYTHFQVPVELSFNQSILHTQSSCAPSLSHVPSTIKDDNTALLLQHALFSCPNTFSKPLPRLSGTWRRSSRIRALPRKKHHRPTWIRMLPQGIPQRIPGEDDNHEGTAREGGCCSPSDGRNVEGQNPKGAGESGGGLLFRVSNIGKRRRRRDGRAGLISHLKPRIMFIVL